MSVLVPYVIEKNGRDERAMDIYSRLLKDRIVILGSGVNDDVANSIVAQLLFLQFDDPKADIHLYINSPGGSITAGMAIYDTMQYISCDVATYCIGQAASMGAILLTAGAPGKRNALPNARIMIHQPLAGMEGTATELEIHAKEVLRIKATNERDSAEAHRSDADQDRRRYRSRQLHVGRRSQALQPDRQRAGTTDIVMRIRPGREVGGWLMHAVLPCSSSDSALPVTCSSSDSALPVTVNGSRGFCSWKNETKKTGP